MSRCPDDEYTPFMHGTHSRIHTHVHSQLARRGPWVNGSTGQVQALVVKALPQHSYGTAVRLWLTIQAHHTQKLGNHVHTLF